MDRAARRRLDALSAPCRIKGLPQYHVSDTSRKKLEAGSYFSADGAAAHRVASSATEESVLYVRTDGPYRVVPLK